MVSDLYDGFLSAEDRRGVHPPDQGTLAPLVKWGNPNFGPYTWPVDMAFLGLGLECGIVNLPPSQGRAGLLSWATLGHEVGGHDILHADTGLAEELSTAVYDRLQKQGLSSLANYWARRIDETASDVLGILNMGPAAGIGVIGYFRGLDAAFGGPGRLKNVGASSSPHPAKIVRGYPSRPTCARSSTGWSACSNRCMTGTPPGGRCSSGTGATSCGTSSIPTRPGGREAFPAARSCLGQSSRRSGRRPLWALWAGRACLGLGRL